MPAAMITSLAKEKGISKDKAEELWDKAKDAAVGSTLNDGSKIPKDESKWRDKHWKYVTGIFKKMIGMKEQTYVESLLDLAMNKGSKTIIEALSQGDMQVRAFFDTGELCFATTEDVLLDDKRDPRLALLRGIVNDVNWPEDHPIYDTLEGYEGSLEGLFKEVLRRTDLDTQEAVDPVKPRSPRRRSLAQKQGARKAGRTRSRRQYAEALDGKAFLYYNYYQRPSSHKRSKRRDDNEDS
jgi:hypothetical protein